MVRIMVVLGVLVVSGWAMVVSVNAADEKAVALRLEEGNYRLSEVSNTQDEETTRESEVVLKYKGDKFEITATEEKWAKEPPIIGTIDKDGNVTAQQMNDSGEKERKVKLTGKVTSAKGAKGTFEVLVGGEKKGDGTWELIKVEK